jgi:hypothetical protein
MLCSLAGDLITGVLVSNATTRKPTFGFSVASTILERLLPERQGF